MTVKMVWSGKGYFSDGKRIYVLCHGCSQVIRLNKPILGSLHFCKIEEDR